MKILKVIAIILFALFFTITVTLGLWCNFTPEGRQWYRQGTMPVSTAAHLPG